MKYKQLLLFRQQVYDLLNFAKDATFELTDAVLTTRNAYSLAEFSLSPFFRRKWPSIDEALQDCRPNRNKLMRLYIHQMPAQGRPILAVDHTVWTIAKDLVAQHHLPWQKPLSNLTPGRVAQSISLLLPEIGTPAISPKPRGKSPGWESGNKRTTKPRYPVVKKGKIKHKKRCKKAA